MDGNGNKKLPEGLIFNLVTRLNQIEIERNNLDLEYTKIIYELWDLIPSLKDDVNIQPAKPKYNVKRKSIPGVKSVENEK